MSNPQGKTDPVLTADAESDWSGNVAAQTRFTVSPEAPQAGAMLRQLRESVGVDAMLLASALKVSPQKIQALEEGRLNELPGLAFARSLATAVCRHFAADPDPVLALMPQAIPCFPVENIAPRESFKPSTFRTGGVDWRGLHWHAGVPGWLLTAVAVLLIGTLVVWFMPRRHPDAVSGPQASTSAATESASESVAQPASESAAAPASDAASQLTPAASAAASLPASAGEEAAVSAVLPAASERTTPGASGASAASASAPQASQHGDDVVEQDVITFNATGRVWIGVYDGSGEPLLNRILTDGDTVSVGGELPLSVTVGNKDAVTVTVRGQAFGLDKYTRRNGMVARFTVGPADNP